MSEFEDYLEQAASTIDGLCAMCKSANFGNRVHRDYVHETLDGLTNVYKARGIDTSQAIAAWKNACDRCWKTHPSVSGLYQHTCGIRVGTLGNVGKPIR